MRQVLLGLMVLMLGATASAEETSIYGLNFKDGAERDRYQALISELRCLVCQNQSLSDSDAPLAQDLREEVHRIMSGGQSDEEVIDFLVDRYGDFVLYRPPLRRSTLVLWFGPAVLLIVAVFLALRTVNRRAQFTTELSAADIARAEQLLAEEPSSAVKGQGA